MKNVRVLLIGLVIALILFPLIVFTVDQRQNALVFQLGEIVSVKTSPGLYFKLPLVQNVRYYDTRIHTLDSKDPERFITSEKKPVQVDSFVKWRIVDVKQFYVSVAGDEARATIRLSQTINDGLRAEFGKRTVHEVVSGEREKIMEILREKANEDAKKIGVRVLDVRLKRVDLTPEVSESVYKRMEAERKRVANELRSTGSGEAEKIRAEADRQKEVILAEAYREAQRMKGEGDAKSSAIYASAFDGNPEFYSFYRSLETYRSSLKSKSDVIVLDPNSDFFKYFKGTGKANSK